MYHAALKEIYVYMFDVEHNNIMQRFITGITQDQ
jgi:hypothetical protein